MGMLGNALMAGVGQGMQVYGSAMMKDAEKQRDEELAQKRMETLMRLQRENAVNMAEDALNLREKNAGRVRALNSGDALAAGADADAVALARLSNKPLNEAERKKTADDYAALTPAMVARQKTMLQETMGLEAQKAGMLARASDLGGGERALRTQLLEMDLADRKSLAAQYDKYLSIVNDDSLSDEEKKAKLKPVVGAIEAIKSRSGKASGKDPDTATDTVTETERDENGQEIRKIVRKVPAGSYAKPDPFAVPGGKAGGGADPYAKPQEKQQAKPAGSTSTLVQDGIVPRIKQAAGEFVASNRKEGELVQGLRQKLESRAPMTAEEKALARKYGLMP